MNYPPHLPDAICETYKSVDDFDLNIWRFEPKPAASPRPAILFFFGGGWRMGSPEQFAPQARHLAAKGVVAMVADYRVSERNDVLVRHCLEDAKAAFRWVCDNAGRLNIDPTRIGASGGSAGGHLAAAVALVPDFDSDARDCLTTQHPDALVLFNPALVLAPVPGYEFDRDRMRALTERMGVDPESLSPYHQLSGGAPPTIIFHGRADSTIAFTSADLFTTKMHDLGNRCELVGYDDEEHGFFNLGRGNGTAYADTLQRMEEFLRALGWLDGTG